MRVDKKPLVTGMNQEIFAGMVTKADMETVEVHEAWAIKGNWVVGFDDVDSPTRPIMIKLVKILEDNEYPFKGTGLDGTEYEFKFISKAKI